MSTSSHACHAQRLQLRTDLERSLGCSCKPGVKMNCLLGKRAMDLINQVREDIVGITNWDSD
jgi:hypothetical protein